MVSLDQSTRSMVEEELRRFLRLLNCDDTSVTSEVEDSGRLRLAITATETGPLLIGPGGAHLAAFEHILHCVIRRRALGVTLGLDVNQYRREREHELQARAREAARSVQTLKRAVVLEPMSASDRRAIHATLSGDPDIQTESLGIEPHRRVVIRPRV